MDVKEELKLVWKCKKKSGGGGGGGGVPDLAGDGGGVEGWSIGRGLVGSNVWSRDCCGVWGM